MQKKDRSGFRVTLGEAAHAAPSRKRQKKTASPTKNPTNPPTQSNTAPASTERASMPHADTPPEAPISQAASRTDKRYVLFMTPPELHVWNALTATINIHDDGEIRVPIPKTEADKRTKWRIPVDMFEEHDLDALIERFVETGLIAFVGGSGNGHNVYRFNRHPDRFLVTPIDARPEMPLTDAWLEVVRVTQGIPAEVVNSRPFIPAFRLWLEDVAPQVNSSTAQVYVTNYRANKNTGWGIVVRNPDERGQALPAYRYLVALPGFEAYQFVSKSSAPPQETEEASATEEVSEEHVDHSHTTALQDAGPQSEAPPKTVRLPSSRPEKRPKNPYLQKSIEELEIALVAAQHEINELALMLERKQKELEQVKKALRSRIQEKLQNMEVERTKLASQLKEL